MRKVLEWIGFVTIVAVFGVVTTLAVTGVPKPPAITAEDVGRVGWRPVLGNLDQLRRAYGSKALVSWLPDGSGVLAQSSRMVLDARLHLLDAPGGKLRFLPRIPRNVSGVYSDPGRDYVVMGWDTDGDERYRLYRWDLGDAEPVLLTTDIDRAFFGAFEPAGPRIAYVSTRRNGVDYDVYLMDPLQPASDHLVLEVEGTWNVADWSPDGTELLLAHTTSNLANELFVLVIATGELVRVGPGGDDVLHRSPQWSRDGRAMYYLSDRDSEFLHLRRLDLATKVETVLSDEVPWDVMSLEQSGDGSYLLVSVNEDGVTEHYLTDPLGLEMERLELFPSGQFSARLHPRDDLLLVNHSDPLGVSRGYVYDVIRGELTLWAGSRRSESDAPEPRLIRYATFDSVGGAPRTISAFVYPGVGDGPRPVVIDIHGGPESQARLRTGQDASQKRGVTTITPNVRGSTGYGRTFTTLDDWYLREDAVRDIGALLDWIETQPHLDEDRVAVIGGSYGGYMVLASLVHYSDRIRCGIDVVGISNFVTFLENTADYRKDLRRAEYGDERIPEMREFLESISPLNHAERITSRLMIVQGANDPRVPVTESRQLVERVRDNGDRVAYMEGANEGHGFRNPWNTFYARLAQWEMLQECLLD